MKLVIVLALLAAIVKAQDVPFTVYSCVEPFCTLVPPNISSAILNGAAPSIVVAAIDSANGQPLFVGAFGRDTYHESSAIATQHSSFDMASLSKIVGATTATAILYQQNLIGLDDYVADPKLLGPSYANQGKGQIKIRNLLLHNAGYPPDPVPGYSDVAFGCPGINNYHPGQNFDCVEKIYHDLLFNQGLINPVGAKFVYSDLSMITLMFVIGKLVKDNNLVAKLIEPCFDETSYVCYYNAYLRTVVFPSIGMPNTTFTPRNSEITPPGWEEYDRFRHMLVKGFVSDENAYMLGGISGHAGIFSDIADTINFMKLWMWETQPKLINRATINLFTTVANLTQSSRALGWDTNDQSYKFCGSMSPQTFTHTGYSGTEFCGDPVTGIATIMLTNARFPNYQQSGMSWYRPQFNSLIHDLYVNSK